jgi:hypothetical protein
MDDASLSGFDRQMVIRRGDVDATVLESIAVVRMYRGKPPGAGQNFRKHTAAARHVEHDKHDRTQITRQLGDYRADSFNSASRCADDDDVVCHHETSNPARSMPQLCARGGRFASASKLTCSTVFRIIGDLEMLSAVNPRTSR